MNLCNSNEVSKILGCSRKSVQRFVKEGKIVPVLGGGTGQGFWFDREAIETYKSSEVRKTVGRPRVYDRKEV